ncbi:MAG: hypothetical protein JSV04_05415 [Candidatus Heimdallarchaeota archaeon]|nr:MAG: hypothetical protein JSV04_05415 [Candidatus Heimdallarchaeota archaeon]
MKEVKKNLRISIEKSRGNGNLEIFIRNKSNAKLGDSLVNFIYSVAKSLVFGIPTGTKVSDSILSEAYKGSLWHKTNALKLTGDKGRIADATEALVLYFWLYSDLDLGKLIDPLISHLDPTRLHHPKEERSTAVLSFINLFNSLFEVFSESK